jgi:hypothetical protein
MALGRNQTINVHTLKSNRVVSKVCYHYTKYVAMTLWCKHLILRIDDACNFKMDAPKGSREYPFALATRAKWSKNVNSFVNCPDQIIFGSNRWNDCLQLHMAAYLEG